MSEPDWDRTPWNAPPGELIGDRAREMYDEEPEEEDEDEELDEDMCPECGDELGFDGICPACGYDSETD